MFLMFVVFQNLKTESKLSCLLYIYAVGAYRHQTVYFRYCDGAKHLVEVFFKLMNAKDKQ